MYGGCFGGCTGNAMRAIKSGAMLPLLFVDYCHTSGHHAGGLYIICGRDGNGRILPLCVRWSPHTEDKVGWYTTCSMFRARVGDAIAEWGCFSDMMGGMHDVVKYALRCAWVRWCSHHGLGPIKRRKGLTPADKAHLTSLYWTAVLTYKGSVFEAAMEIISMDAPWLHRLMCRNPPCEWSNAHAPMAFDISTQQMSEAFNSVIFVDRKQPSVLAMFHGVLKKVDDLYAAAAQSARSPGSLLPHVAARVTRHQEVRAHEQSGLLTHECKPRASGRSTYRVKTIRADAQVRNGQLVVVPGEEVVDMQNRSCTCGKWQKSGVVCWHGEEVCRAHGQHQPYAGFVHRLLTRANAVALHAAIRATKAVEKTGESFFPVKESDRVPLQPPSLTAPAKRGRRKERRHKRMRADAAARELLGRRAGPARSNRCGKCGSRSGLCTARTCRAAVGVCAAAHVAHAKGRMHAKARRLLGKTMGPAMGQASAGKKRRISESSGWAASPLHDMHWWEPRCSKDHNLVLLPLPIKTDVAEHSSAPGMRAAARSRNKGAVIVVAKRSPTAFTAAYCAICCSSASPDYGCRMCEVAYCADCVVNGKIVSEDEPSHSSEPFVVHRGGVIGDVIRRGYEGARGGTEQAAQFLINQGHVRTPPTSGRRSGRTQGPRHHLNVRQAAQQPT